MKLNNKGWGTTEMILLSTGLFIALLVAVFFISKLYGSLEGSIGNKQYIDLENSLEVAAKNYIDENNISVNGEYKISYETLKTKGFLTSLEDKNGKGCSGYVIVTKVDGINHFKGYILCSEYQTLNY